MKTRVQKWGNSLAVRIPKPFAEELDWEEGAPVEMAVEEGALVIKTDRERAWDLDTLMSGVTDDNLHPAWQAEPAGPIAEDADGKNAKGGEDGR